jgi:drug/metabolite transporter (DMT)-like permease
MLYIGELAAIAAAMTYSVNSTLFTDAGRKIGSAAVNRIRLIAGSIFLVLAQWIILGTLWPVNAGPDRWFWLGMSGIVGFVLGDAFLFQAFVWVGPRISMLMMSLAPIIASIVAWMFLGEKLTLWQMVGILITLAGIAWVVIEKDQQQIGRKENYIKGIWFGLGAAVGQGLGMVLAKNGLGEGFSPISANFIRMLVAMITILFITFFQREFRSTIDKSLSHPRAFLSVVGGSFVGPVMGVSLSLFALQHTSIGIASTLVALPPIFLLPIERIVYKERFGWSAVAGTLIALLGVAILILA